VKAIRALCSVALLPVVLAGCGATYSEYRSATEIPDGPGMLSGKDGAFVLYSTEKTQDADEAAESKNGRDFEAFKRWKEANRDSPEYREFREWQEWKAFQAWKRKTR